jgi:ParB/RepB/Spo0J family partition protein
MQLEWHQITMKYERTRIVDAERDARLMVSLEQVGQQSSVLVVGADGGWVLIDGYRRVRALRRLGHDTVQAVEMPLTELEALVLCHRLVNVRRRTALEDGWLIRELLDGHGQSQREVARMLCRSHSWVSRRLSLVRDLPVSVQEHVRGSKICAQAAMKYLVPLARANAQHSEMITNAIADEGLSARQVGEIYAAWRKGDAETREKIATSPMLFVRVAEESHRPEPPDPMEELMHDVETVGGLSRRARRRVRELERVGVDGDVVMAWRESYRAVRQLNAEINRNARAGQETGDPAAAL